ncbi:MAG TPA: hypothetical protein ENJ79_09935 [Gammaproteobacteria bacterium]|nr:hypothetical protein [Gammaproteobacteria bacterium]
MSQAKLLQRLLAILLLLPLMPPLAASADEEGEAESHKLPFSDLVKTEPERRYSAETGCVEPEDEMKRNHMKYILHQRDDTMHRGIRTRKYALEECINCHAVKDENGEYVRVEDSRHFCATCHTYAAVHIDCFQCHSDVPVRASKLQTGRASAHTGTLDFGRLAAKTPMETLTTEDEAR